MTMRVDFFDAFDFNRMLIVSVFVHLFSLTIVMFLPKPDFQPKKVIPAFMVNLIELPSSKSSQPREGSPVSRKKIVASKPTPAAKESKIRKALPRPPRKKTVASKPTPDITEPKRTKAQPNPLLQELDQLALLPLPVLKKTVASKKNRAKDRALNKLRELKKKKVHLPPIKKSEKLKKPPVIEETLDELKRQSDALKNTRILPDKSELPKTIIAEDVLKEETDLKMQNESETGKKPSYEKLKLAKLSKATLEKKETGARTAKKILAELEALSANTAKHKPRPTPPEVKPSKAPLHSQREFFQPILQKLASLIQSGRSMEIEVANPRQEAFKSTIHKRKDTRKASSKISPGEPKQTAKTGTGSSAPKGEKDSTDILSLYVGTIQRMIFEHWKSPLGTEYNDIVEVSFYLYPKGNIDKPTVVKKSSEKQLDTLAVRAIYDSEPFPKFPDDLKNSNLHIKIKFKYKPANE